jgi:hypothetical protein
VYLCVLHERDKEYVKYEYVGFKYRLVIVWNNKKILSEKSAYLTFNANRFARLEEYKWKQYRLDFEENSFDFERIDVNTYSLTVKEEDISSYLLT